jgi:hypothetical protein
MTGAKEEGEFTNTLLPALNGAKEGRARRWTISSYPGMTGGVRWVDGSTTSAEDEVCLR